MTDLLGDQLVHRDACVNVRPGRLLDPDSGQERTARPRMVAGTILAAGRVEVVKSADHLDLLADRRQRLHRATQLEPRPLPFRPPGFLVYAVGDVKHSHPERRTGARQAQSRCRSPERRPNPGRQQGLKRRQGHGETQSTEEVATARCGPRGLVTGLRMIRVSRHGFAPGPGVVEASAVDSRRL